MRAWGYTYGDVKEQNMAEQTTVLLLSSTVAYVVAVSLTGWRPKQELKFREYNDSRPHTPTDCEL
jgi:hypothetical protein